MPNLNKTHYTFEELRQQAADVLETTPHMEIALDGDELPVIVPHPLFVDDETQARVEKAEGSIDLAVAILGDGEHERFIAHGGRSNDIVLAWRIMQEKTKTVAPNGNPTQ